MFTACDAVDETVRSVQLYGVRPDSIRKASQQLVSEHGVQHIDLNFGCPVKKVTSRGGGSAVPLKLGLLKAIVQAAVQGAGAVPVTVKMRIGVSPSLVCPPLFLNVYMFVVPLSLIIGIDLLHGSQ